MEISKIYQKELNDAIKLAIAGDSLDVGKSIVYYAKLVLNNDEVKKELNIDFDQLIINPAQHNPNKADIILLKKNKVVRKINAKTCVSGNLESTLISLRKTKRHDEDGLIIFGLMCAKSENVSKRILGTVFIDKDFLYTTSLSKLLSVIIQKLKQKQKEENCKELTTYSLNQLIAMEAAVSSIKAAESSIKAAEFSEKALNSSLIAKETAYEAKQAALEAKETTKEVAEFTKLAVKKIDKLTEIVSKLVEQSKMNKK